MSGERVVVVGAGIMGRAAAWHLSLSGASVTLLDRQPDPRQPDLRPTPAAAAPGTPARWTGSSHGATRGLRYSYEDPAYARLAMHAETWWRVAERVSGARLLRMTGGLDLGYPGSDSFDRTVQTVCDLGLDHELLEPTAVRERFPAFDPTPGMRTLYQPGAGLIDAAAAMEAFVDLARDAGAEVAFGTRVERIDVGETIMVDAVSSGGAVRLVCDRLVLAAGPWTGSVLEGVEGRVRSVRPPLSVLRCEPVYLRARAAVPLETLFYVHPEPADGGFAEGVYAQPQIDGSATGTALLKVGRHGGVPVAAPSDASDSTTGGDFVEDADALRARLSIVPRFGKALVTGRDTCFYTMTPDDGFVLDYLDLDRRVVLAAGFSGHGFKFAPVIGRAIAELLLESGTDFEIAGMALDRF